MAEQAIINTSTLTSIGDAIRTKTGKTDTFLPSSMPEEILAIETGSDVSAVTAVASDVRSGKKFVNSSGTVVTGTVTARTSSSVTTSNNTVSIPAGIYDSAVSKTVGTAKAAATYTPGTSNQTIASGYYLTGTQTIKGDANLVASNIPSGITIFGVAGSLEVTKLRALRLSLDDFYMDSATLFLLNVSSALNNAGISVSDIKKIVSATITGTRNNLTVTPRPNYTYIIDYYEDDGGTATSIQASNASDPGDNIIGTITAISLTSAGELSISIDTAVEFYYSSTISYGSGLLVVELN